jgi:hypothetical protein
MKTSEMLLWILGTTLLAVSAGAHYWGEHQRRESLASFAEVGQAAPVDWLSDVHADEAVPAGLVAGRALPRTLGNVGIGIGDVQVLDDTGAPMFTLVNCYPFDSVGNDPQHYIVRATVPE